MAGRPWASRHNAEEVPWGNATAPASSKSQPTGAPKTQPRGEEEEKQKQQRRKKRKQRKKERGRMKSGRKEEGANDA